MIDVFSFVGAVNKKRSRTYNYGEWPPEYDRAITENITNPYTGQQGIVLAQRWSWPHTKMDSRCLHHDGNGSHIHALLSIDNDWLSLNGNGIYKIQPCHDGAEHQWYLSNGDPRGAIWSPRYVDESNPFCYSPDRCRWDRPPFAGEYRFIYKQRWEADLYVYDCFSNLRSKPRWAAEVLVRAPYEWNFGYNVGQKRVLEFWQGNDVLWEITLFAEGIGYVGYRQWWYQAGTGREAHWAANLSDNHYVRGTYWEFWV